MSDPSAPQSSKSRRFRGKEPPSIELGATRVEGDETASVEPPPETASLSDPDIMPDNETPQNGDAPPEAVAAAAPPPPRSSSFSGKAAVTGLIFGLIGGVAGAGLMQVIMPQGAPKMPAQNEAQLKALETRLASAETAVREAGQKTTELTTAQQTLRQTVQATGSRVDALTQQPAANAGGGEMAAQLDQRIAALDGSAQAAATAAKNQIDTLQRNLAAANSRFDTLEKQVAAVAKPAADPIPAIRYVLIMRLEQAVASGKPFENALKALRDSGANPAELANLNAFATAGAPTAAQLKAAFKEPAEAMIAHERGQSGESFTDKLTRMGKSVLRVRPQGTPDGTDAASMVVRIEAALDRSAFTEAAGLWNGLPDAMKQLSAAWGKRINDRASAANAVAKLSMSAVSGLEGTAR